MAILSSEWIFSIWQWQSKSQKYERNEFFNVFIFVFLDFYEFNLRHCVLEGVTGYQRIATAYKRGEPGWGLRARCGSGTPHLACSVAANVIKICDISFLSLLKNFTLGVLCTDTQHLAFCFLLSAFCLLVSSLLDFYSLFTLAISLF